MKRYSFLAIFLVVSLIMYATAPFHLGWAERLIYLDGNEFLFGVIASFLAFCLAAPTLAVCVIAYNISMKLGARFYKSRLWPLRLWAIASVLFCLFGIPYISTQLLERQVREALALDSAVTEVRPKNVAHVRLIRSGPHAAKCDGSCRHMLKTGALSAYTAVTPDVTRTFAFQVVGSCSQWTDFETGRDSPLFQNFRDDSGRCIVTIPAPDDVHFTVLTDGFDPDTHFFGTKTTITDEATGDVVFYKSHLRPNTPFPVLGLVKPKNRSYDSPITFGLSRYRADARTGIEQDTITALGWLIGSPR